jgi:hypothetical protein
MKVKHSKFKNTAILFELLVKQITHEVLSNSKKNVSEAIIKEFFNSKRELAKELKLYNQIVKEKYSKVDDAKLFLEQIVEERKKLDEHKLNKEKYNLIKSIKEAYELPKFLSSNLQNYKLLASIYKIFETKTNPNGRKVEIREYIDSNNLVLEHIARSKEPLKEKENIYETFSKQSEDLRLLTYKLLIDNFNKKYSNLDESQKSLLREFINNVSNTSTFPIYIKTEINKLYDILVKESTTIPDKVTKIKVQELLRLLKSGQILKENQEKQVSVLMLTYELLKEIKNVKANRTIKK